MPAHKSKPFYDPPTDFEFITHRPEKIARSGESETDAKTSESDSSRERGSDSKHN